MGKTVTLKETRAIYAVTPDEAQLSQAPFTIERDGNPVAAVIPIDEYREFTAWREQAGSRPAAHGGDASRNEALAALEKERAAFLRLKEQLLRTHRGKYVAILDGQVIDADADDRVLTKRVYAEHGYVPIYIDQVTKEAPVRRLLSPKKVAS